MTFPKAFSDVSLENLRNLSYNARSLFNPPKPDNDVITDLKDQIRTYWHERADRVR